jgi:uncharacterized repeat protein (TIGR01451 family)
MKQQRRDNHRPWMGAPSKAVSLLAVAAFLGGAGTWIARSAGDRAIAQTDTPQCVVPGILVRNQGEYSYSVGGETFSGITNIDENAVIAGGPVTVDPDGVRDLADNRVTGSLAGSLADQLIELGFSQQEATRATIAVTVALAQLPVDSSFREVAIAARDAIVQAVPEQGQTVAELERSVAQETAAAITAELARTFLVSAGLTATEAEQATQQAFSVILRSGDNAPVDDTFRQAFQAMVAVAPDKEEQLRELAQDVADEMREIRQGIQTGAQAGDLLFFDFTISNPGDRALRFTIPDPETIQRVTSGAQVRGVKYSMVTTPEGTVLVGDCIPVEVPPEEPEEPPTPPEITPPEPPIEEPQPPTTQDPSQPPEITPAPIEPPQPPAQVPPAPQITPPDIPEPELPPTPTTPSRPVVDPVDVILPPGGEVTVTVEIIAPEVPDGGGGVTVVIPDEDDEPIGQQTVIIPPATTPTSQPNVGRITGCAGEILPDYTGFKVGLFEPDPTDPTGGIREVVALTPTEFPDLPGNDVGRGFEPNVDNANPFFLTNGEGGTYNFSLDASRGQLDPGRQYIFVVSPPTGSDLSERRIRLEIGETNNGVVSFTATSLDGRPINAADGGTKATGSFTLSADGTPIGLNFGSFDLTAAVCEAQEIQIIKTSDRAAAEPGDTVIYRLAVRNLSSSPLNGLFVTDLLPFGFQFHKDSPKAEIAGTEVNVVSSNDGRQIRFDLPEATIPAGEVLNLAYAARVSPDALRGNGRNSAFANGQRTDTGLNVKDGPAIHQLQLDPGILSDCGTLIGRVFVDKNFNGLQEKNEPGIPNAVVFMDDGNRIITDANGLFSVANVVSGYRTAVLDLSSVPGYTLAPNLYFSEGNSQSRLVRLEPGGMARVNFAVTPTFQEEGNLP